MRRVPDLTLARELLGYTPQISLEEGLTRTLHWQVERMRLLGELPRQTATATGLRAVAQR